MVLNYFSIILYLNNNFLLIYKVLDIFEILTKHVLHQLMSINIHLVQDSNLNNLMLLVLNEHQSNYLMLIYLSKFNLFY